MPIERISNVATKESCSCSNGASCKGSCKNSELMFNYKNDSADSGLDSCSFGNCSAGNCCDGDCSTTTPGAAASPAESTATPAASSGVGGGGGTIPDAPCISGVGGTLYQGAKSLFGFGSGNE